MIKRILNNARGFSILEAVVGMGILGIGVYVMTSGMDYLSGAKGKADTEIVLEKMVSSIVEGVRSNIAVEKIDFKGASKFLALTNFNDVNDSLEMRWNKKGIMTRDVCEGCPGRIGYVITEYTVGTQKYRGLYQVTVRFTHKDLFPNRFKQYRFIVRGP